MLKLIFTVNIFQDLTLDTNYYLLTTNRCTSGGEEPVSGAKRGDEIRIGHPLWVPAADFANIAS